jgi:tRNA G18 (ribose-2'-O)-methylase SpoU
MEPDTTCTTSAQPTHSLTIIPPSPSEVAETPAAAAAVAGAGEAARVECLLMFHNVSKRHNIGPLVRSGVAFGASEIILVGQKKMQTFGNQGTNRYIRFTHFLTLEDAREHLHQRAITIVGM